MIYVSENQISWVKWFWKTDIALRRIREVSVQSYIQGEKYGLSTPSTDIQNHHVRINNLISHGLRVKNIKEYVSGLLKNREAFYYRRKSTKRKISENDSTETKMYECANEKKRCKEKSNRSPVRTDRYQCIFGYEKRN